MTPEEYAALKALVDELLALTKGGDDLSGVEVPDDFVIEDVPKPEKGYGKGQYIAEIVNQLMKANEERDAAWGAMQDSQTATKALARVSGGDGAVANPYANKGQLLGIPAPSVGKAFRQSAEMKELIKHKGKGNVQFSYEISDDDEFHKFLGDMGIKANVATYGGPFLAQDISVFPILQSLAPLDMIRVKPITTDRAYFQTYSESSVAADSTARGAQLTLLEVDAASTSKLIQNVGGVQYVSEQVFQDEMEAQNIIDRLVRFAVRKELQDEALNGTGGTNDGDDINGVVAGTTGSSTSAMVAANNAHALLTERCEALRSAGATPRAIFTTTAVWGQLWELIAGAGFALIPPGPAQNGMIMVGGVPVLTSAHMGANVAEIYTDEGFCIAMRMDVMVEVSDDYRFRNLQKAIRAYVRVASHVEQLGALYKYTAVGTAAGTY